MKNITKRIISLLLTMSLLLTSGSMSQLAMAKECDNSTVKVSIEDMRESFYEMDSQTQEFFEALICQDEELCEFHKSYVDNSFEKEAVDSWEVLYNTYGNDVIAMPDSLSVSLSAGSFVAELKALNLPETIRYVFNQLYAQMHTMEMSGVITAAAMYTEIGALLIVLVLAADWLSVKSNRDKLTKIFIKYYSKAKAVISETFKEMFSVAERVANNKIKVKVDGHKVTIEGVEYECTIPATSVIPRERSDKRFMPAVKINGIIYVAVKKISDAAAEAIIFLNRSDVGVMAHVRSDAQKVCGGRDAVEHGPHKKECGYYSHFHVRLLGEKQGKSHAWYW